MCAIDCGSSPTPIIIAGDNWGNPGIPGTIPGGLGKNDEAGDGDVYRQAKNTVEALEVQIDI